MKLLVAAFLALVAVSTCHPDSRAMAEAELVREALTYYEHYKITYNKTYETQEEILKHQEAFVQAYKTIQEHNERYKKGEVTWYMGFSEITDYTKEEFAMLNGLKYPEGYVRAPATHTSTDDVSIPRDIDWRKEGRVSGVKNQGNCGSCWSFSATGALEGQHKHKTNQLVSLSEQNLIDCDKKSSGCNGGVMQSAFDYIRDNHGIDTESSYPYETKNDRCRFNKAHVGATDTGYNNVAQNEDALKNAVGSVGPISVGISVIDSFQHYKGGVYYDAGCKGKSINHGVLVVGYNGENGHDYWLVKNSWGGSWGDGGYIKMARGRDNNCYIASDASYPNV